MGNLASVSPLISASAPEALDTAEAALLSGQPIVVPTDTVYGLAVAALVPGATKQIFSLKARSETKPLAVLVADRMQAGSLAAAISATAETWMTTYWPGALTLVLRRSAETCGLELGGDPDTIGVRCPDHTLLRSLAARVGPLATTSANRHGEPTPPTAMQAAASLGPGVALVLDGGPTGDLASTVVDATVEPWRVLRHGAVTEEQLRSVI